MFIVLLLTLLLLPVLCVVSGQSASAALLPMQLRCEYRTDPLGVDTASPRLSWIVTTDDPRARGLRQTAYQILVASSSVALAQGRTDLWDSGVVRSDQSLGIAYAGKTLLSTQDVFWKARVWDQDGRPSAWSPMSQWTMGLLAPQDWKAQWIGVPKDSVEASGWGKAGLTDGTPFAPPDAPRYETALLRKEFTVRHGLRRAVAFVCGLGQYEMTLNGIKAGDDLLAPGWTDYRKTCLYDTRDITALLHPGANAVGLLLGNGMYNVRGGRYTKFTSSFGSLKAIVQIRLEYADGTAQTIGTDVTWHLAPGPITFSEVYGGEDYDARLAPSHWDSPDFAGSGWVAASVTHGPGGALRGLSCANPPIRAFETFPAVATRTVAPGTTVYDMGQNAAFMPRLTVDGPAGSLVRITPAELLHPDGTVDRTSVGGGAAYWQYTLSGSGAEHYFPHFFYHGCRYLQVECIAPPGSATHPVVRSLKGVFIHADAPAVGTFASSSVLFDRISTLVRWAQMSNMMSVMTDCPHRERLGWLEEDHLNGPSLRYDFGLTPLFAKIANDMADAQLENGLVPSIAPEYVQFGATSPDTRNDFGDSPEWGSSMVLVPWQQYEFDGDLGLLRRHYDAMERYVAYLGSRARDGLVDYGLGDWYDIGPNAPGYSQLTPRALTATAFYYQDTVVLAKTAALLGKEDDAVRYTRLAGSLRDAFNTEFYNAASGQYATGSQCANAIPLVMGLVPPEGRPAVLENVVKDVREKGLTAGDVGYRYLLRALADGGRSDVVYALNNQSVRPGYGMQLAQGATSLTEAWDALRSSSQNHFMLGQIIEWLYHDLAGIQNDGVSAGFRQIIIKPAVVGDLTWARADYDSVRGRISSGWKRAGRQVALEVTIPPNTTATVFVPTTGADAVTETGHPAGRSPGVRFLRMEDSRAVYAVGSGHYMFAATLPK